MAPLVAQRRLNISTKAPAAGHLNSSLAYCVWRVPIQHHTMRAQAAHTFMSGRGGEGGLGRGGLGASLRGEGAPGPQHIWLKMTALSR